MPKKPLDLAISDLTRAIGLLVRRMRAASGSDELSLTEAAVMADLERNGASTIADLARAQTIKPQSMGTTVATLEAAGLLERTPHPTDGRQVLIRLTIAGVAMRRLRGQAKRSWLGQAIAELDAQEQATLFAAGEIIKRLAEK